MTKKTNGSGYNGHNRPDNQSDTEDEDKIVHFPSADERRHLKEEEEQRLRELYRRQRKAETPPFFNTGQMPVFAGPLVALFILVHLYVSFFVSDAEKLRLFYNFGFVPLGFKALFTEFSFYGIAGLVTHVFIHGGWTHLIFNGVMAFALGTFAEKVYNVRASALLFFICSIGGALAFFALNPSSTVPVIGASSGISGYFGAIIVSLHQSNRLGRLSRYGIWPLVGFWALFMVLVGLLSGDNIAWQAHLGGFLCGVLIALKTGWLSRL